MRLKCRRPQSLNGTRESSVALPTIGPDSFSPGFSPVAAPLRLNALFRQHMFAYLRSNGVAGPRASMAPGSNFTGLDAASRAMQRRMDLEASITADWVRLSEVANRPYRNITTRSR